MDSPKIITSADGDAVATDLCKEMENAFTMSVPLSVEIGLGNNWLEAH